MWQAEFRVRQLSQNHCQVSKVRSCLTNVHCFMQPIQFEKSHTTGTLLTIGLACRRTVDHEIIK